MTQTPNPNEWRGEYYNNPNLQGQPVMVRNDPSVNFDWGYGSPAPNIPVDYFSARWTRSFNFDAGMVSLHGARRRRRAGVAGQHA